MSEDAEKPNPDSPEDPRILEDRIAACPIHAWIGRDMQEFLHECQVPPEEARLLQEAFLIRGEYPAAISAEDAKLFAARTEEAAFTSGLSAESVHSVRYMFQAITIDWMAYELAKLAQDMAQATREAVRHEND
jgi:hypothetical protein